MSTTRHTNANAYSDRTISDDHRLINDKNWIKITELLTIASPKSNILSKDDDFSELLRAIINTGD